MKLSDKIHDELKRRIVAGEIDARDFIAESEVAKEFGTSKAPVRDAIHLLCSEGYLISYPRKGYMVNLYSEEDLRQIQQVRVHLEKLSISLAVEHATDEEILSLRQFTKEEFGQMDPQKTNNTQFHKRLAEISGNRYLPETLSDLLDKVALIQINVKSDLDRHNRIVDAILARDKELALKRLDEDVYIG